MLPFAYMATSVCRVEQCVPGELGGADWAGASADVVLGVLFVPSKALPAVPESGSVIC